jgi:hypothetical protein
LGDVISPKERQKLIHEIIIPIDSDINELGVIAIKLGISDMTYKTYFMIEGAPEVRLFIYFKRHDDMVDGIYEVLHKRDSCPDYALTGLIRFVECNFRLFNNAIRELEGFLIGV